MLSACGCDGKRRFEPLPPFESHPAAPSIAPVDPPPRVETVDLLPKPEPDEPGPLDIKVTCLLSNASIRDACAMISALKQVNIIPSPEIIRYCDARGLRLSQSFVDMPMAGVLDWISRQIDGGYIVVPDFGVWLVRGHEWLAGEEIVQKAYPLRTSVRFKTPIDGLYDVDWERGIVIDLAKTFLRTAEEYCPGSGMRAGTRNDMLLVSAPESAHAIMQRLLFEITSGARGIKDEPPPNDTKDIEKLAKQLEQRIFCHYADMRVVEIIAALSKVSGVNIGLDARNMRSGATTRISLDHGESTLSAALGMLIGRARLGKLTPEPGRGVWITGSKKQSAPPRTSRIFWNRAVVRSYFVADRLAGRKPEQLVEQVRAEVTPDEWGEFGPALGYHPAGRLIVLHDEYGQKKVGAFLAGLPARPLSNTNTAPN